MTSPKKYTWRTLFVDMAIAALLAGTFIYMVTHSSTCRYEEVC
jgi:hypothetical protein